jgi:hypothetical protein
MARRANARRACQIHQTGLCADLHPLDHRSLSRRAQCLRTAMRGRPTSLTGCQRLMCDDGK